MLRKALLAGVAMVSAVAVLTGTADARGMQMFHRAGAWASYAGINEGGYPMCMSSTSATVNYSAVWVDLKFDMHSPNRLGLHLTKKNWSIPDGTALRVALRVDNAVGRNYRATGHGQFVQIAIDLDDNDPVTGEPSILLLQNLLRSGSTLHVDFIDGKEPPWQASLNGSGTEMAQLTNCIKMVKTAGTPTQPYGNGEEAHSEPTQPFDSK